MSDPRQLLSQASFSLFPTRLTPEIRCLNPKLYSLVIFSLGYKLEPTIINDMPRI